MSRRSTRGPITVDGKDVDAGNPLPVTSDLTTGIRTWSGISSLASGGSATIRFYVSVSTRVSIRMDPEKSAKMEVYENPVFSAVGLWQPVRSSDRSVDDVNPHVDDAATVLAGTIIHTGRKVLLTVDPQGEASTTYAVKLTDLSLGNNEVGLILEFRN